MRRALSLLGVFFVVACNSVLDIPEAHPKTALIPDTTSSGDDDDTTNTATCDKGCNLAHALATCKNGACAIESCDGNFKDCNNNPDDGCEVDVSSDKEHCLRCDLACGAGLVCEESICRCHDDEQCGGDNPTCGTDDDDRGRCYCNDSGDVCAVGSSCDGHKCAF